MEDRPELFTLANTVRVASLPLPSFSTPLGRLDLNFKVGGELVSPTACYRSGERSVVVYNDAIRMEFLLALARIKLPTGLAIDGALMAIWRVGQPILDNTISVDCVWAGDASWSEVGVETGENLDAQTWTDGRTKVTVGLQDYADATTYRRDGFEVAVRSLRTSEGHFLCAWGPDTPDDLSTWFAVDFPTAWLLREE